MMLYVNTLVTDLKSFSLLKNQIHLRAAISLSFKFNSEAYTSSQQRIFTSLVHFVIHNSRYGNTSNKNVQFVSQHCCETGLANAARFTSHAQPVSQQKNGVASGCRVFQKVELRYTGFLQHASATCNALFFVARQVVCGM